MHVVFTLTHIHPTMPFISLIYPVLCQLVPSIFVVCKGSEPVAVTQSIQTYVSTLKIMTPLLVTASL